MMKLKSSVVAGFVAISLFSASAVVVPNQAKAIVGVGIGNPAVIAAGAILTGLGFGGLLYLGQSQSPVLGYILLLPWIFGSLITGVILLPADSAHGYQPTLEFTPIPLEQRIQAGISRPEYGTYMMERALLNSVIQQIQAELPADSEINQRTLENVAQRIEELRLDAGISDQSMAVARKILRQATRQRAT